MLITRLRRSIDRMMLMNVLRRLLFVPAATVLLFAWIIGILILPFTWPLVWILTGQNVFDVGAKVIVWMEEQVERILPE